MFGRKPQAQMESHESQVARPPGKLDRLLIPESVLERTITGLALGGGREMLCYWIGVALQPGGDGESRGIVTTTAFPRIHSSYDHFEVAEGQVGLVTEWCAERGLWVLAQVHTHPTDEPHSEADKTWPASHREGFLSVVIPFFAQFSSVRQPNWRLYESLGRGRWQLVDAAERFEIIPSVWLPEVVR